MARFRRFATGLLTVAFALSLLGASGDRARFTLRQRTEPVLISSRVFQKEIAAQIRQQLRCQNPIILLYPG